jgi:hypothetical protein
MSEKVFGYLLVLVGIALIAFSVVSVHAVFTNRKRPYPLFEFPGISFDLANLAESPEQKDLLQGMDTRTELISPELINKPMNTVFHLLFMGFVASAGLKLGQMGTYMVRTIKVSVKEEKKSILEPK